MGNLTVTNGYSGGTSKKTLSISGNVEISNYKQNEKKPIAFAYANVNDNTTTIQQKSGKTESLDLSTEKYNALLKMAASSKDDGKTTLTLNDLRDMSLSSLGLDSSYVIKKT